ncbi:MAG: flagellar hook-associated protein FlgK [Sphingomonadaceae bacterium]
MAFDLFNIGASGARAARAGLDVTGQNIANAATAGYVRRSVDQVELAGSRGPGQVAGTRLGGVRVSGIQRNATEYLSADMRRTSSNSARASAELSGMERIEIALDHSGIYESLTAFETALKQLEATPLDSSAREMVMAKAGQMTSSFNLASKEIEATSADLRFMAEAGVAAVNQATREIVRINTHIALATRGTAEYAALSDQRDLMLGALSEQIDISVVIDSRGVATISAGGPAPQALVDGQGAYALSLSHAPDGTIDLAVGANPVTVTSGRLAGYSQALQDSHNTQDALDQLASTIMTLINNVQGQGIRPDGGSGALLFSGTGAAGMALLTQDHTQIAHAAAGAAAGSRDGTNIGAMRATLENSDIAGQTSHLILGASSRVEARKLEADTLAGFADASKARFERGAGVDLDQEATSLLRFQQAFQASGKVMQAASDMFDTMLGIR